MRPVPPPGPARRRAPNRTATAALCAAALTVLGTVLTACGGGGDVDDPAVGANSRPAVTRAPAAAPPPAAAPQALDGRALADRALALMAGTSYRITGTTTVGGETTTLDIRVNRARDAVQTATGPAGRQEHVKVGGELYVDVESMIAGMGAGGRAVPADLRGTYLRTDPRTFDGRAVDPFAGSFGGTGEVTKGTPADVRGRKALPLEIKGADGTTTTMYVLADGEPYAVRFTVTGADPMELDVTDIGTDITVTAPAKVVDLMTLQRRLATG